MDFCLKHYQFFQLLIWVLPVLIIFCSYIRKNLSQYKFQKFYFILPQAFLQEKDLNIGVKLADYFPMHDVYRTSKATNA